MNQMTQNSMIKTLANLANPNTLINRRCKIQDALESKTCAIICAGEPARRNFPANHYQGFRASSHFLYLVGQHLPGAILLLSNTEACLFHHEATKSSALWHGEEKSFVQLSTELGCDVQSLSKFPEVLKKFKSHLRPPSFQSDILLKLRDLSGRDFNLAQDAILIDALIQARLVHDEEGIAQLKLAAELTRLAHQAGVKASKTASWAHQVRASMEKVLFEHGAGLAYAPIVTPHGEVLHNHHYHSPLQNGDLILADVGAETPQGWAGDVTRTWPVNGQWTSTQADVYAVVLNALKQSSALAAPGVEYASLHQKAREVLTQGLIDLRILKGTVEENLDANSVSLFFPHGIGHLLGLDVHDMEDLGDRAGYAPGRARRASFGWGYLRLDRTLQAGMAITVEPGFYQVPALLNDPEWAGPKAGQCVNWERLTQFQDVRGIRIEDDLLITSNGHENLSELIPYEMEDFTQAY